ncbi:hypothetical protein JTE90_023240 [Oedothorax gibbosus]|uniref:Uncharacterized protein n=1 Tax=Oedothorax gibbosus TaxID=931172 RepID=A0AAV6TQS0_9ARAC|nr:hypothetical protein JTE90_023240 [Oedothorax gibbosus]
MHQDVSCRHTPRARKGVRARRGATEEVSRGKETPNFRRRESKQDQVTRGPGRQTKKEKWLPGQSPGEGWRQRVGAGAAHQGNERWRMSR